jgi:lambda family phage tail tape measure protein
MADAIHRGVIEVAVDGTGVTAGVEQIKQSLGQIGDAAANAGNKLGAGVAGGATRANTATGELDATTKRFMASLERESMQAGRSRAEFLELRAAKLGVAESASTMIARIKESEKSFNAYGLSAKQTTAALRQVPAQLTDIFVSLQGGQAPLTVLLQQGGQLKDIFGGVVPAAQALGGALLRLINPFTLAAAGIGALVYGYSQGSKEGDEFNKTLVLTGNAAGSSVGELDRMAASIGAIVGTQGNAAEALNKFAASGRIAANDLERFTTIAVKLERLAGVSVDETVKKFNELGKSPVEASRRLNEAERYLTLAVYEQIKALEEQGRAVEAANLAQRAYADAAESRLPQIALRLGYIQQGWLDVKDAANAAADALLKIGRPKTDDDARQEILRSIADLEKAGQEKPLLFGKSKTELRAELEALDRTADASRRVGLADKERAQVTEAGIKAEVEVDRIRKESASNQDKLNKTLTEYRRNIEAIRKANPESTLLDPKKIAADEANIREKFKGPKGPSAPKLIDTDRAELDAALAEIKRFLDAQVGAYRNGETLLEAVRAAGLVNEAEYYEAKRSFIRANQQAQDDALAKQIEALNIEQRTLERKRSLQKTDNDKTRVTREIIDNERKIADAQEKRGITARDAATQIEVLDIRQAASLEKIRKGFIEAEAAAQEYIDTLRRSQAIELLGAGLGTRERSRLQGRAQIEDRFSGQRLRLESERRQGQITEDQYSEELDRIRRFQAEALSSYDAYYRARLEKEANFATGASEALQNYLDSIRNVASETESVFNNAFKGMEDALVKFTMTGKLDFKSLADSIVADINRIIIRQQITGPIAEWLQGGLKTGEGAAGSITGFVGSLLGGKSEVGTDQANLSLQRFSFALTDATYRLDMLGRPSVGSTGSGGGGIFGSLLSFGASLFGGPAPYPGGFDANGIWDGRAMGGSVDAGRPYQVGEFGRELFIPRTAGTIVPAAQTSKILQGGETRNYNISVNVGGDPVDSRTAQQQGVNIGRAIREELARGTA